MMRSSILAILVALVAPRAIAACPDSVAISRYLEDFTARRASVGFGKELTGEEAHCARDRLIKVLPGVLGERVGYKSVFTTEESQRRFGVSGPAWGAMFSGMMLASPAQVSAQFGAKPRYEADFIAVVKDAGLAEAATPLDALKHLSAVIPFIELPDLMLDQPTGPGLIATNAAFRGGVLGQRIAVEPTTAFLQQLAEMDVVVSDAVSGKEIARAPGSALMGQPIEAALWLARALKADGVELKPGDMLSLGGFVASAAVKEGMAILVTYRGLAENPAVRVDFR